jgi:RES domain-containing protein
MTVVRLHRSRYSPKDSTGARLYGGRWNSPGNDVLYASSTLALACLEVLVHFRDVGLIPTDYVFCEIDVPEDLIGMWPFEGESALARIESPVLSREFGDQWFRRTIPETSGALRQTYVLEEIGEEVRLKLDPPAPVQAIPSVIIPREMNYLISPVHPRFGQLAWGEPKPFGFDPRLIATAE